VVVLARPSAANQYLFDAVADSCRLLAVLTDAPRPGRRRNLPGRGIPVGEFVRPARRAVLRRLDGRLDREVRAALPVPRSAVFAAVRRLTAGDLNGEVGTALLRELAPDLLILSGAPLLKPQVFGIPRLGTINLHWGIAPEYRGQESIFTALRRGDHGAIGMTVHYVDEGVDTGPVLAQGRPALEPGDTLATLWAKTARVGATMLGELLEAFGSGPVAGTRRTGPGVNVRSRDRRVRHHVRYGIDRAVLRRHPPHAEERIVRYWSAAVPVADGTTELVPDGAAGPVADGAAGLAADVRPT
jgi:hypothetical protein